MNKEKSEKEEEKKEEESELEEDIKETESEKELEEISEEVFEEEPGGEEFVEFLQQPQTGFSAPVLEERGTLPESSLEQNIISTPTSQIKDEGFRYDRVINQDEESKYQGSDGETISLQRTNIESLGREPVETQGIGFLPPEVEPPSGLETYVPVESSNVEQLGKQISPFERQEIKYKPSR